MPKSDKKRFVVEFRFPVEIKGPEDAKAAAEEGRAYFSQKYGFIPDLWNARVFEYGTSEGEVGAEKEYFFSPTGMQMKEISKNINLHEARIKNESVESDPVPFNEDEG